MRIIHLSYSYVTGYNDPASWLAKIGHTCGVFEAMAEHDEVIGIYHLGRESRVVQRRVEYYFTKYSSWQLLVPLKFNGFVKELGPDVVIVHGLISPWQVLLLRWAVGEKVIIIAHHHAERPLKDIRQYFQRWADRFIKAYLFSSPELGKRWVDRKQIKDVSKINEVMGMSSIFHPMEMAEAKKVTKVSGEIIYLWVGALDENKDPLIVIRAFAKFHSKHNESRLYMIYQTFQLLDEVTHCVNNTTGADGITLVGRIDYVDLQYWYSSADFVISSSHYEGAGIAVCEGLSCGCIPILTSIPSFKMMTDNGRVGLLFEAGNDNALLESLNKSLKINRDIEKRKVLERFNSELSFQANAIKIRQVIQNCKLSS